ncbi:MAG: hypothetical protein JXA25_17840 [Anaerolineales bacterium]|nr:hypothetical protein [Anaerolineales bacterium]
MIHQILDYFQQTGRKVPELLPAVIFAQTELGETFDAIMRSGMVGEGWLRNNERDSQIEIELADTYMMLLLAAASIDVDLDFVLTEKMLRKGWQPPKWLLQIWTERFSGEESEDPVQKNPMDKGSEFLNILWLYCQHRMEAGMDYSQQRSTLLDDLKRQRENLDGIIADIEEQIRTLK